MTDLRVIPLICPQCGNPLTGLRYDRVFFCLDCKKGLEPAAQGWLPHPLHFAAAANAPKDGKLILLPMWKFKVDIGCGEASRKQEAALSRIGDLTTVWVAGFNQVRPSYYGDLGLAYTEGRAELTALEDIPDHARVAGCVRGPELAFRYAELYVTLILDKKADVTGMQIQVTPTETTLWAVPLLDQGDKIMDLQTGLSLPPFSIDDLEALRHLRGKSVY